MDAAHPGAVAGSGLDGMLTKPSQETGVEVEMEVEALGDSDGYEPLYETLVDPVTALLDEIGGSSTRKRKSSSSTSPTVDPNTNTNTNTAKRARLHEEQRTGNGTVLRSAPDRSAQLPAEIWHHIFTFLLPKDLGRLLGVNKLFHSYLDPSAVPQALYSSFKPASGSSSGVKPLKAAAIWQASRRSFWPRVPAPLKGKSELEMWRMTCSLSCQFCGFRGELQSSVGDQWYRGPGRKEVSPIFAFSIVSCGRCLKARSTKEIDLLLSSSVPSVLLPALPVVFLSDDLHVIPPRLIESGITTSQPKVRKIFWTEHLEEILEEFASVKAMGSATAEEWFKGLESRGKQAQADASRWERWSVAGGVHLMRTWLDSSQSVMPQVTDGATNPEIAKVPKAPRPSNPSPETAAAVQRATDRPPQLPEIRLIEAPTLATAIVHSLPRPPGQHKRTMSEVVELKAKRKAEIERRALLLEPPLSPNILALIPSFQAALQIITPLDDNTWELLKPRLLSQREMAENMLNESIASTRAIQDQLASARGGAKTTSLTKKVTDSDWNDIQGPVRARLAQYADEIIGEAWGAGEKVTKKSCRRFAAEVLIYVRQRFYAEVAKDAEAALKANREPAVDPPEGPWTQKLTVENLKWLFDLKVKPITEQYRNDLFSCNGCVGIISRWYGLEAVIQHYAAKHTTALSLGNVVVHWRAEWPEQPPFRPFTSTPRNSEPPQHNNKNRNQINNHHSNNTISSHKIPDSQASEDARVQSGPAGHQAGPAFGFSSQSYGDTSRPIGYSQHQPTSFPPNIPLAATLAPFGATYASQPFAPAAPAPYYSTYPPEAPYWAPAPLPLPPTSTMPSAQGDGAYLDSQQANGEPDATYKSQLSAMARISSEIWNMLSVVNDLPVSVRVCVIVDHIAKKFQDDYHKVASLEMFIDALTNHQAMRGIPKLYNLRCKACQPEGSQHMEGSGQKCTVLELATHFHTKHVQDMVSRRLQPLDWRTDMVLLPDASTLKGLRKLLDKKKAASAYALVAETLPWAFDTPAQDLEDNRESLPRRWPSRSQSRAQARSLGGQELPESADGYSPPGPEYGNSDPRGRSSVPGERVPSQGRTPGRARTPGTYRPHPGESERAGDPELSGHVASRFRPTTYTARPDVPNLEPARIAYSRGKLAERAPPRQQSPPAAKRSTLLTPRGFRPADEDRPQPFSRPEELREPATSQPDNGDVHSVAGRSQHRSVFRDGVEIERRNTPGFAYYSREPLHRENGRLGDRWEHDTCEPHRASGYSTSREPPEERPYPDATEYRGTVQATVVYADSDGRELRKTSSGRYVYRDEPSPQQRRRSLSPRYPSHPQPVRCRSPIARFAEPYRPRAERPLERYYYDEPVYPMALEEDYEIVEVRDPQGDYLIKRPITRELREYYAPGPRPEYRNSTARPSYRSIDDGHGMEAYRPPLGAQTRPPPEMGQEEYDPRYPAVGDTAPR